MRDVSKQAMVSNHPEAATMTMCLPLLTRIWTRPRDPGSRWFSLLALATLLLAGLPARATNYTFPGALPPGCTSLLNGNYTCGTLTLADDDTVTIDSPQPATITFIGAFTAGANTKINAAGSTADLNISASAAVTIGVNAILNANVSVSAAVNTGAGSSVGGNIVTTLPTGVVTIGAGSTVGGYIQTDFGAATVGADSTINGKISTLAGVVAIGERSQVKGAISTSAGAITTSADVTVKGNISAQAGVITIGARNNIEGMISTDEGGITVGLNSSIGGINTPVGVITLTGYVTSTGDIVSGVGAVNVGDYSRLCGQLVVYGAGIVTLTTNVKIDGSVSTTVGGITMGADSTVGGNVTITGAGVATLTQVLIGGNVSTTSGAITMTNSKVRGSVSASGAGVVTLTATTVNDSSFTIAPACVAAPPIAPPLTLIATFDALESGTNAPWSATARKPLYTKLIGTPFTLDIAALKTDGTLESAYVAIGAIARHVKLELFDDTTGAACSAYTNPVAVQTASFSSTSFSGAPGRTLSGTFTVPDVHRSLLVRIKECVNDTCTSFTGTAQACSSDRFAVRPPALTLSTTNAMPSTEEPTATASQTIRAGTDFTLQASNSPVGAYAGVLTLDASKLTAQSPLRDESAQIGGDIGVLKPSTLAANAPVAMATYSEAGYLYIAPGAYRDDNFTAVDSAVGDCITSTVNNNYLADTLIDGKYGCSIGNKLTVRMGRFIPNHFSTEIVLDTVILKNKIMPCPAGLICPPGPSNVPPGFIIYSRQPFTITVTARSLSGTPTLNYRDKLARDVALVAWSTLGGAVAAGPTGSVLGYSPSPVAAATFNSGVAGARPSYAFANSYPATPLTAPTDIYLRADETGPSSDGVTSLRTTASSSIEAGIKVVSGRLHVANNYGSELLAVPVVVHAQYWDGKRFVNSSTDQKTSFASLDVTRSNCKKNLISGGNCKLMAITAPALPLMINGMIRLTMAAPGAGNAGSVDLSINSFDWLPSTTARIGVGIYKATPVIYIREMY
jgi:hypothetical protein